MIRDVQNIDDDIVRKKRIIGEMIYNDADVIEILDNKDLDPSCPDEYMYQNIYPFIRIPGVQDVSKSYITFMLDDMEPNQYNRSIKNQQLKVIIFVHKDLVKTKYGAERHDLLAYLIKDIFHLSNALGMQMTLVSNKEGVTDLNYCTRTLHFDITTPNSIKPNHTNQYEYKSIVGNKDKVVQHENVGGEPV